MIPLDQAALAEALLGVTTNSESQAQRFAREIIQKLDAAHFRITMSADHPLLAIEPAAKQ